MTGTVLVTGCSSGIGEETARRFHATGWDVYATARDSLEVRNLDVLGCRTATLDVTDDGAVESIVDRVFEETGRLDCLVNNAGYGQPGPVEDVPTERVVDQFDVNTFGPVRLIEAALPRMRERGGGTIVNVGGGMGGLTPPGLGIYTGSKFALHSITDALRQELASGDVDVVLVEPGIVATEFYDRALAESGALDRTGAYDDLYRVLDAIGVFGRPLPGINSPGHVAGTILEAAEAEKPKPVYRVGPTAVVGTAIGALVRGRVRDRLSRLALWLLSRDRVQRFLPDREDDARVIQVDEKP